MKDDDSNIINGDQNMAVDKHGRFKGFAHLTHALLLFFFWHNI